MSSFLAPLAGGALIGLSATLLLVLNGRVAGISGIAGGLLESSSGDRAWRLMFLGGLVLGGVGFALGAPQVFGTPVASGLAVPIAAGLLVGFGTRLGGGCTSGHGICGISRGAARSIAATLTFMLTGALTVFVVHQLLGGLS